jgi:hypothetical protein
MMTLSDLASIGSLVSGVAVLVSLVYLSSQVRQTEKNQRALMESGYGHAHDGVTHLDRGARHQRSLHQNAIWRRRFFRAGTYKACRLHRRGVWHLWGF